MDEEMSLSIEDLVMIGLGLAVFVLAFTDVRSAGNIVWISFPVVVIFLVGWGIVRFRRRPLPKQVHYKRNLYLLPIKIFRNYHLLAIIIEYLTILFGYYSINEDVIDSIFISLIGHFGAVFVLMLLEFAGNVTISDSLDVLVKLDKESEEEFKLKRKQILFGTRFYIYIAITSIIVILSCYFPVVEYIGIETTSMRVLLLFIQIITLIGGAVIFYFVFRQTMNFKKIEDASLLLKAVDYYESMEIDEKSITLLNEYLDRDPLNVAIISRLSIIHAKNGNYDEVLQYTGQVLEEIEKRNLNTPHMSSRAHLLRAFALKSKERYKEAYKEVTHSLKFTPENNAARKLRRDLRRIIKAENKEK